MLFIYFICIYLYIYFKWIILFIYFYELNSLYRVPQTQHDSGGEEERSNSIAPVKPSPKPRRAKLLARGRKLGNRKRGRPKKAATATAAERKNKKSQSALDLLHAKTLSAAPPQGERLI